MQDKTKPNWSYDPIRYEYFDKNSPNMDLLSESQVEEFRLYYVAITRAKLIIENAEWLTESDIYTLFQEDSSINLRGSFD